MQIFFDTDGRLGTITLSNPPHNNLSHPVFCEKEELLEFLNNPALTHVILTGEGKHFCGGADLEHLKELAAEPKTLAKALDQGKELLQILSNAPVPVAALIRGSWLGGGLELALSCHFRFASKNAMLGFPESGHGLMPGLGGTILSGDLFTRHHLIDLLLSGRMIRGDEALEIGLVDTVCPSKEVEKKLLAFLQRLSGRHTPKLIRSVMRSIHNGSELPTEEALAEESRLFCELVKKSPLQPHPDKESNDC